MYAHVISTGTLTHRRYRLAPCTDEGLSTDGQCSGWLTRPQCQPLHVP